MIKIEQFIEDFAKGINILQEFRINREDIRILISPFVFRILHNAFQQYVSENLTKSYYHLAVLRANGEKLTLFGVEFGPTEGWPNHNVVMSFKDADIISPHVKPIILVKNESDTNYSKIPTRLETKRRYYRGNS